MEYFFCSLTDCQIIRITGAKCYENVRMIDFRLLQHIPLAGISHNDRDIIFFRKIPAICFLIVDYLTSCFFSSKDPIKKSALLRPPATTIFIKQLLLLMQYG
mgnify:CR=1 FL=1